MKKHILFIVENNSVPYDVRVWNEATAANDFGYKVTCICPKTKKTAKFFEVIDDIQIFRHPSPVEASSKYAFLFEYLNALLWEFLLSILVYIKSPFHVIHSANPPDHVFLISIFYKLFKVRFIFDHHDISPENYLAKFNKKDFLYKTLCLMERASFIASDMVISTNNSYKNIAITRGKQKPERVFVVRNGPNLKNIEFPPSDESLKCGFDYLIVYVGNIGNQEGIVNLLESVDYIVRKRKRTDIKFVVIGTGPDWNNMVELSKNMKLEPNILFTGFIPYKNFYGYLATADLCVNPEFSNPFTDKSTMIKIMDYMTFGKPIVQFETTEGKVTAQKASVYISENSTDIFADKLLELLDDPQKRQEMGNYGRNRIINELNWDKQKLFLLKAYKYLFEVKN